jgi:muramoyltetrapeptide carboxypeptidase
MSSPSKPRALRSGDLIEIVSPASPLDPEKLQPAVCLLEEQGYRVRLGRHVFERDFYLAGSDQQRAEDLRRAFADEEVGAVYCSRGGYGCARLLPHLDLDAVAESGKMFLGFSDITTLHLALNRRGLVTFHAPMALTLSVPRENWVLDSFLGALKGEVATPPAAPRGETLIPGVAEGVVTGGCLCLLTDSLGTSDSLDARGKILLIEDVDENPHRIDAMLTHLLNAGVLASAAGIVVGEMTNTDSKIDATIGGKPWREIIRDRIEPLGIPTVVNYPFGHMSQMLTLPLGIHARLDAEAGTLNYLERACSA